MSNLSQPHRAAWTQVRLARLVELWTARLSATQIAQQLGDGLTRSAVVGKLFRMGLTLDSGGRAAARADGARQSRRKQRTAEGRTFHHPPAPFAQGPPCPVKPLMIDILDLQTSSCRWPYLTPDGARFCGHVSMAGSAYCQDHRRRAYDAALPALTREQIENIVGGVS